MNSHSARFYNDLLASSEIVEATEPDRGRLGELVSKRRRELGLSISAAARNAGIDRATWTGTERGARRTEAYNFAGIERALTWEPGSIDRILTGGEPAPADQHPAAAPEPAPDFDLKEEIDRVLRLDYPASTKLHIIQGLMKLHEQAQRERETRRGRTA